MNPGATITRFVTASRSQIAILCALLGQAQPLLAIAEGVPGPHPLGHVAGDPPVTEEDTVIGEERDAADLEGDHVAPAVVRRRSPGP